MLQKPVGSLTKSHYPSLRVTLSWNSLLEANIYSISIDISNSTFVLNISASWINIYTHDCDQHSTHGELLKYHLFIDAAYIVVYTYSILLWQLSTNSLTILASSHQLFILHWLLCYGNNSYRDYKRTWWEFLAVVTRYDITEI